MKDFAKIVKKITEGIVIGGSVLFSPDVVPTLGLPPKAAGYVQTAIALAAWLRTSPLFIKSPTGLK